MQRLNVTIGFVGARSSAGPSLPKSTRQIPT